MNVVSVLIGFKVSSPLTMQPVVPNSYAVHCCCPFYLHLVYNAAILMILHIVFHSCLYATFLRICMEITIYVRPFWMLACNNEFWLGHIYHLFFFTHIGCRSRHFYVLNIYKMLRHSSLSKNTLKMSRNHKEKKLPGLFSFVQAYIQNRFIGNFVYLWVTLNTSHN